MDQYLGMWAPGSSKYFAQRAIAALQGGPTTVLKTLVKGSRSKEAFALELASTDIYINLCEDGIRFGYVHARLTF